MKISVKLVSSFILISVIITSLTSFIFFINGTNAIKDRVLSQLESVSVLKENQLNLLFHHVETEIETHSSDERVVQYMKKHHYLPGQYDEEEEEQEKILSEHLSRVIDHAAFTEIFILDLDGKVDLSTDMIQKGKIKENEDYFIEGLKSPYNKGFYYSLTLQSPAITFSGPIKDQEGKTLGVFAGRLDMEKISDIMLEHSGLGETGETYLINKFNYMITESRFEQGLALKKTIYTDFVEECIKGNAGQGEYKDYRDIQVFGVYRWIPELEVCIISEMDIEEAFEPINDFRNIVVVMGSLSFVSVIFFGLYLSFSISHPIKKLTDAAKVISRGELKKVEIKSQDEVGDLAATFNQMVDELIVSNKQIEKHQQELENAVEQKTKELQSKVEELEKFNKLAVGRELKMIELKRDIRELENQISELKESKTKK